MATTAAEWPSRYAYGATPPGLRSQLKTTPSWWPVNSTGDCVYLGQSAKLQTGDSGGSDATTASAGGTMRADCCHADLLHEWTVSGSLKIIGLAKRQ